MLKSVINLFETNKKVIGNHSRDGWNDSTGHVTRFKYHGNVICIIEWKMYRDNQRVICHG